MERLSQSPTDPDFVQNPYTFYDRARAAGDLFYWEEYGLVCATSHRAVTALLKDRRLGREAPPENAPAIPDHLAPFYAIEAHSMLELEPPRHTRLRGLVLRGFTSRRIAAMDGPIREIAARLLDTLPPDDPFDLIERYARPLPVLTICRLLGVPETAAPDLLRWSNAMVAMYQARRTRAIEDAAVAASHAFTAFIEAHIAAKRAAPADDLISELIAAHDGSDRLSTPELVTTCILLLNAGHEATVHSLGNATKTLLETGHRGIHAASVEEALRHDPPLHMFTRWVYEDLTLFGQDFRRGDRIACLLGAANHDPDTYPDPQSFDPARTGPVNTSFGAGLHFCVGAPLARLELRIGLAALFHRLPDLTLAAPPRYADLYHFHGLDRLMVRRSSART